MINLFQSEATGLQLHCGTAITGEGAGRCKNSKCRRHSPSLLGGYCTSCSVEKGVNPLKACGFTPIRLGEAASATVAAAASA